MWFLPQLYNKGLSVARLEPIFSSDSVWHKDYYHKSSVEKISGRGSLGAWRQSELIGGKPPVVM
jgi:hypothetical protein